MRSNRKKNPKWVKTRPSVPGWYWCRWTDDCGKERVSPVKVESYLHPKGLANVVVANNFCHAFHNFKDIAWGDAKIDEPAD